MVLGVGRAGDRPHGAPVEGREESAFMDSGDAAMRRAGLGVHRQVVGKGQNLNDIPGWSNAASFWMLTRPHILTFSFKL